MRINLTEAQDMFDHLHEVVWLATADWRELLYVNPAFERVWGFDRARLFAGPEGYAEVVLATVHPGDRARVAAEMARPIETERELDYRIVRPDGAVRWIRGRRRPVRDDRGHPVRMVGLAEDITALKHTELAQARLLAELQASTDKLRRLRGEMVTMCAWTKRIQHAGRWMSLEEFLAESLDIPVTHGLSPPAYAHLLQTLPSRSA